VYITDSAEYEVGFQNNFFVMKPEGKWVFRTEYDYLSSEDGLVELYIEPVPYQRYKIIQWFRFYRGDEDIRVNENKFMERFNERTPITRKESFEKFKLKYETVFNWLCVKHGKRDSFWRILEQYYKDIVFDTCFEIRLEEIVWKYTDPSRKYWRTEKTISSRKRRNTIIRK
jgi:hypothetical protein